MSAKLTDKERGEIALKFLKHRLSQEGMKIQKDMYRGIMELAKQTGVDGDKAVKFASELMIEMLNEYLLAPAANAATKAAQKQ